MAIKAAAIQTSNHKAQISNNHQTSNNKFGNWDLDFVCNLVLGI
jgi:hypothetical protein